jgi:CRISPR-associated protein Csm4
MKTFRLTLRPLTAFGTPMAGDTLFGHLCWAALERWGSMRLGELLAGYTEGRPWLVVSDGFPAGFLPRPTVPDAVLGRTIDPARRKVMRRRVWLPAGGASSPLGDWLDDASAASERDLAKSAVLTQNTINRLTGTTGTGQFAPRQVERDAYERDARLDVYAAVDDARLDLPALRQLFQDVGDMGYGRDASTGLGKFSVEAIDDHQWPPGPARHWLCLAPCAPDTAALDAARCYYHPLTRFGRHGNLGVRLGVPFKRPLLLTKTGALLTSRQPERWSHHGRGLGGRGQPLSAVIPDTVHQGYAPVVPVKLEAAP